MVHPDTVLSLPKNSQLEAMRIQETAGKWRERHKRCQDENRAMNLDVIFSRGVPVIYNSMMSQKSFFPVSDSCSRKNKTGLIIVIHILSEKLSLVYLYSRNWNTRYMLQFLHACAWVKAENHVFCTHNVTVAHGFIFCMLLWLAMLTF